VALRHYQKNLELRKKSCASKDAEDVSENRFLSAPGGYCCGSSRERSVQFAGIQSGERVVSSTINPCGVAEERF
jgi:hypothetical protein